MVHYRGMDEPRFIPLDALAETLKLPRRWLRTEADANRIPHLRIGNRRLFDVRQVRDALARIAERGVKDH